MLASAQLRAATKVRLDTGDIYQRCAPGIKTAAWNGAEEREVPACSRGRPKPAEKAGRWRLAEESEARRPGVRVRLR